MTPSAESKRIGVIFGGRSSEREVSLSGGRNVYLSLDRRQYNPTAVYWDVAGRFWDIPETLLIRNTTKEIEERLTVPGVQSLSYEELPKTATKKIRRDAVLRMAAFDRLGPPS